MYYYNDDDDNNNHDDSTTSYRLVSTILARILGIASIVGSSYIIHSLLWLGSHPDGGTLTEEEERQRRRRRCCCNLKHSNLQTTFQRFLLLLSIFDIISSISYAVGTWPIPEKPPEGMEEAVNVAGGISFDYHSTFPGAMGTPTTCVVQGFMNQLGWLGSLLFTGFLSLQYVFLIRYQWTAMQMKQLEFSCYTVGILMPLGSSIYLAATNQFHPLTLGLCWINHYPIVCDDYFYYHQDQQDLEDDVEEAEEEEATTLKDWCHNYPGGMVSSEQTSLSKLLFAVIPSAIVFVVVVTSMILLWWTVRQQELRSARWSHSSAQQYETKAIRKGILLIGNYVLMYVPVIGITIGSPQPTMITDLIMIIFLPIQGILNALVYSNIAEKFLLLGCCHAYSAAAAAAAAVCCRCNRNMPACCRRKQQLQPPTTTTLTTTELQQQQVDGSIHQATGDCCIAAATTTTNNNNSSKPPLPSQSVAIITKETIENDDHGDDDPVSATTTTAMMIEDWSTETKITSAGLHTET